MKKDYDFIYYYEDYPPYTLDDYLPSPICDHLGRRFSFSKKAKVVKVIEHIPGSKLMGEIHVKFQ